MAEIHKLTKDGQTILPATTTDAVVHPQARVSLTGLVNEYNVSVLYPTEGVSGNKYTLQRAITVLNSKLSDEQKTIATRVAYIDSTDNTGRIWRYLGAGKSFTDTSSWSREDSWFIETNKIVDNLEETLVSTALRKTAQTLTEAEQEQVRININAASQEDLDNVYVPTKLSELSGDSEHRVVTDAEKTEWSNKSEFSGSYTDLTNKPSKLSEFENDPGYITDALEKDGVVQSLKEVVLNTYSKEESNELITTHNSDTEAHSDIRELINDLYEDVEKLKYYDIADYCVGEWTEGNLSATAAKIYGDPSFLDKWDAFLIDCTQNTESTVKPVGKLMKNNYLRFEDGSFAPTVGITEERRAECDVALFLDNSQTNQYCGAGEFNAEIFYNTYGMNQKLYNADGAEVNILRPWETTETKYTIVVGRLDKVYLIDNVLGKSGKRWKGLFSRPVVWDGIDVSKYALEPTGISPCPVTTVGTKTRNFFYLYSGETNCKSGNGISNLCTFFVNGRTYPRVVDMQQMNNMKWARANNSTATNPYPFAEGGFHALNTFITSHEVQYGTKYLHNPNLFSSGISSNDGCSSESAWLNYGGVRWKVNGTETWSYGTWATTPSNVCYNTSGSKTYWSYLINNHYPKEQCMESQMAASYAQEMGVAEGTEFSFYGGTYWYKTPTGATSLNDGRMNARVYKKMTTLFSAYNTSGNSQNFDVEMILRIGLANGVNLSGDIFAYWGGGYEQVGTVTNPRTNTDGSHGTTGNPVVTYIEPDQSKWLYEESYYKNDLGVYDFESVYEKTWSGTNLGDGWIKTRDPYTAFKKENGGSVNTGECAYGWTRAEWADGLNRRYRISARFRGYANSTACSPRHLHAYSSAAITWYSTGGSAQILLRE